jgi:hypothetical protein
MFAYTIHCLDGCKEKCPNEFAECASDNIDDPIGMCLTPRDYPDANEDGTFAIETATLDDRQRVRAWKILRELKRDGNVGEQRNNTRNGNGANDDGKRFGKKTMGSNRTRR